MAIKKKKTKKKNLELFSIILLEVSLILLLLYYCCVYGEVKQMNNYVSFEEAWCLEVWMKEEIDVRSGEVNLKDWSPELELSILVNYILCLKKVVYVFIKKA